MRLGEPDQGGKIDFTREEVGVDEDGGGVHALKE